MNEPRSKETQHELFEEFSKSPKKQDGFQGISNSQKTLLFSTTFEQLLMYGILLILLLCGVFFLGVVRGKSLSQPLLEPVPVTAETHPQDLRPAPVRTKAAPAARPAPSAAPAPAPEARRSAPAAADTQMALPSKPYTIQLVTHRKKELAEAEMAAIRRAGFYSFIIPSGEYFQVCAGQYASKDEAKKDLSRFAAKWKDCFLRRR
jgi:septal ring-binding cell division protein DamX